MIKPPLLLICFHVLMVPPVPSPEYVMWKGWEEKLCYWFALPKLFSKAAWDRSHPFWLIVLPTHAQLREVN